MIKNSLLSKFLSLSIVLGGAILVGNESAFAFNINVGSQSSSRTTSQGSNDAENAKITTTYTGVPIPNFPGETMTCTIIDDGSRGTRFEASCENETLSAEDLPDGVTIDQVISQFTPVNNESRSFVSGQIFDADQFTFEPYLPGAIEPREISIDFTVTITEDSRIPVQEGFSNSLVNRTFDGSLTYYSLGSTGEGEESFSVSDISFRFLGTNYTNEDDTEFMFGSPFSGPEVLFSDGELLGLSFDTGFLSLYKDSFDFNEDGGVRGSVEYTLPQASQASAPTSVPEPSAIFGLLVFSAMGYSSKLKGKKK
ncbi:MAG: hypothetical protein QNJ74_28230 [Trichodesmium sp. MO_231.B1]|nr:hypothetical protein [Trichodesmium sp. MO_231.B1]